MKANVIIIHPLDNVAVALEDIMEGSEVRPPAGGPLIAVEKIPYSHKVALVDIPQGDAVRKYGEVIGSAAADIPQGAWVHTHNLAVGEEGS